MYHHNWRVTLRYKNNHKIQFRRWAFRQSNYKPLGALHGQQLLKN